jgi:predicted DNA-binding transcriptional regulator YafY
MEATDAEERLARLLEAREDDVRMLVSVKELAAHIGVSERTIHRRRERAGVPWRDVHGQRYSGDGPKRISVAEWKRKAEIPTSTLLKMI